MCRLRKYFNNDDQRRGNVWNCSYRFVQTIQHAHQKGIIHRDISRFNVMVTLSDEGAVPKVIDFGVAKATEQN